MPVELHINSNASRFAPFLSLARTVAGWLYKKNPRGVPGMRMWKRRWCVLRDFRIEYYTGQKDDVPKGEFEIERRLWCGRPVSISMRAEKVLVRIGSAARACGNSYTPVSFSRDLRYLLRYLWQATTYPWHNQKRMAFR